MSRPWRDESGSQLKLKRGAAEIDGREMLCLEAAAYFRSSAL